MFKMQWQGPIETRPQIWTQSSNPLEHEKEVKDYRAIDCPYSDDYWYGLSAGGTEALLDGCSDDNWNYAIGTSDAWDDNDSDDDDDDGAGLVGLPGPSEKGHSVTELYAAIDPSPDDETPDDSSDDEADGAPAPIPIPPGTPESQNTRKERNAPSR